MKQIKHLIVLLITALTISVGTASASPPITEKSKVEFLTVFAKQTVVDYTYHLQPVFKAPIKLKQDISCKFSCYKKDVEASKGYKMHYIFQNQLLKHYTYYQGIKRNSKKLKSDKFISRHRRS
jgi:hypothetical protein